MSPSRNRKTHFHPFHLLTAAFVLMLAGSVCAAPVLAQTAPNATPSTTPDASSSSTSAPDASQAPPAEPPAATAPPRAATRRAMNRERRIQQIVQQTYNYKFEVSVGGGYLRFRPGPFTRHVDEGGWEASATRYFNPRLGLTVDGRGYYGTPSLNNNFLDFYNRRISEYYGLVGPTYRLYGKQKYAVRVYALGGVAYGKFDGDLNGAPGSLVGLYNNGISGTGSAGAAFDYNISPDIAVRIGPDLLYSRFGSQNQLSRGFTGGVMYRFGKR